MYCSIQTQKMKTEPAPSFAFKNAHWKPCDNGSEHQQLDGDMVKREKREKYRLILKESYRVGNEFFKHQWQIITINYYDIADCYFASVESGYDFDAMQVRQGAIGRRIGKLFPDADRYRIYTCHREIERKLAPLAEGIIRSYQRTEEYRVKLSNLEMKKEKAKKEEDRKSTGFNRGWNRSSAGPALSADEKKLAKQLIKEGYRRMAQRHHPDVGGDTEVMKILNSVKEKLMGNY